MGGKGSGRKPVEVLLPNELLTANEKTILQMLANGKLQVEIRLLTGRKRTTIVNRVSRLKAALNAKSLIHAVAIALREGMIK